MKQSHRPVSSGAFLLLLLLSPLSTYAADSLPEASREQMHSVFGACIQENNLAKPAPGQPPSEADRKVLDTCLDTKLAAAGLAKPAHGPGGPGHGGHHHHGPPPADERDPSSAPSDGQSSSATAQ